MNKKAFTLLELLVVVLIIGILAAIALPQYQIAVGKSRFSTLKNLTRTIAESSARYYMINNNYPKSINDLDIKLNIKASEFSSYLFFVLKSGEQCHIWSKYQQPLVACYKNIFGVDMGYYIDRDTFKPKVCITYSANKTDKMNRLCQQETNRKPTDSRPYVYCDSDGGYCSYSY